MGRRRNLKKKKKLIIPTARGLGAEYGVRLITVIEARIVNPNWNLSDQITYDVDIKKQKKKTF